MPPHPSLAFHDLVKRLGNLVPASPKDVTVMQRRLIRAGIREPERAEDAVRSQGWSRGAVPPIVMAAGRRIAEADSSNKLAAVAGGRRGGFLRAQRIRLAR